MMLSTAMTVAFMVDELNVGMENPWNDSDGKSDVLRKKLSQCHSVHHNSHTTVLTPQIS
jgi:hypothetical protein